MKLTPEQQEAIRTVGDAIVEAAEATEFGAPSGVVYAALMSVGIRLAQYQSLLAILEKQGRIVIDGDLIKKGTKANG